MPDAKPTEGPQRPGRGRCCSETGLTDALALRLHMTLYGALEGVGQMLLPP